MHERAVGRLGRRGHGRLKHGGAGTHAACRHCHRQPGSGSRSPGGDYRTEPAAAAGEPAHDFAAGARRTGLQRLLVILMQDAQVEAVLPEVGSGLHSGLGGSLPVAGLLARRPSGDATVLLCVHAGNRPSGTADAEPAAAVQQWRCAAAAAAAAVGAAEGGSGGGGGGGSGTGGARRGCGQQRTAAAGGPGFTG